MTIGLIIYGYFWIYKFLDGKLLTDIIYILPPSAIMLKVSLFVLLIGMVVGMIGSYSAVRKYLKI